MSVEKFPTVSGGDWREAIRRGRVESNAASARIALAVARWRLLRALRRRFDGKNL